MIGFAGAARAQTGEESIRLGGLIPLNDRNVSCIRLSIYTIIVELEPTNLNNFRAQCRGSHCHWDDSVGMLTSFILASSSFDEFFPPLFQSIVTLFPRE